LIPSFIYYAYPQRISQPEWSSPQQPENGEVDLYTFKPIINLTSNTSGSGGS